MILFLETSKLVKVPKYFVDKKFMKKIWAPALILLCAATAFASDVTVSIEKPAEEIIEVNAPTLSLNGVASGLAGVMKVTWQTSAGATGIASGTGSWEAIGIPVAEGNTTIYVRAFDVKGASARIAVVAVRPAATVHLWAPKSRLERRLQP